MSTRVEIVSKAFRRIGVKAEDEALTADQIANGGEMLDSIFSELFGVAGPTWDLDDVPTEYVQALVRLLAVELAPDYGVPPLESRGRALLRLMAIIRPDDRADADQNEYY